MNCNINQSWTIEEITQECPPPGWEEFFASSSKLLKSISSRVEETCQRENKKVYPLKKNIFKAFDLLPPKKIRVVIVGEDPYSQTMSNGKPLADGLAFSIPPNGVTPRSLDHIFRSLEKEGFRAPPNGNLRTWVDQGVLLLNSSLTLCAGQPGSNERIWLPFIRKVLDYLGQINPNLIYLLWGRKAQSLSPHITGTIIKSQHPVINGFEGHFKEVNLLLRKEGKKPINWSK